MEIMGIRKERCFQRTYEELKPVLAAEASRVCSSFQRTYEELKLMEVDVLEEKQEGFQRTYEELKLLLACDVCFQVLSFQRTYEELKRFQGFLNISPSLVLFVTINAHQNVTLF